MSARDQLGTGELRSIDARAFYLRYHKRPHAYRPTHNVYMYVACIGSRGFEVALASG